MTHRTTFALDEDTAQRLKRLARLWSVAQADVVRRAVDLAEKEGVSTQRRGGEQPAVDLRSQTKVN